MVPETWSMTDRTLCNFGPFLPFYAPKNPKNLNFQKIKNTPEDTIILQKCTKIHDHMPHRSWDTLHNRCNSYFLFWAISCHVTLLTTKKSKFLKNGKKTKTKQNKKHLEISSLYICAPKNNDHMMYGSWNVVWDGQTDRRTDGRKKWHIEVVATNVTHC